MAVQSNTRTANIFSICVYMREISQSHVVGTFLPPAMENDHVGGIIGVTVKRITSRASLQQPVNIKF